MNKKVAIGAAIVIGIVAVAIIAIALAKPSTPTSSSTHTNTANSSASTVTPNGKTETITYTDQGFNPSSLTVAKGTTIKVVNNSSHELQFSSGPHPIHTEDPEINLGVLQGGQSASFVVKTVGNHTFHNHLESEDSGTLTVTE